MVYSGAAVSSSNGKAVAASMVVTAMVRSEVDACARASSAEVGTATDKAVDGAAS